MQKNDYLSPELPSLVSVSGPTWNPEKEPES